MIVLPLLNFLLKIPLHTKVTKKQKELFSCSSWKMSLPTHFQIGPHLLPSLPDDSRHWVSDWIDSEVIQTWEQKDESHMS
jgi:hypothetical protein